MDETQRGKYTFRVHKDANKLQVKAAIEELFKVDVRARVNVSTPRPRRSRATAAAAGQQGWTSPWKKAVVTLAAGQKIEFFEGV